jgi:hypothetical protein
VKQKYGQKHYDLLTSVRKEIEEFEDLHLKLLKLLKKEGFTKRHLQKIGIFIDCEIGEITLAEAISRNFMEKLD